MSSVYEVGILLGGIGIILIGLSTMVCACCMHRTIGVGIEHVKIPDIKIKHTHDYNIDYNQWKHLENVFKNKHLKGLIILYKSVFGQYNVM